MPFESEGVVEGEAEHDGDSAVGGEGESEGAAVIELDLAELDRFAVVVDGAGDALEDEGDEIHGGLLGVGCRVVCGGGSGGHGSPPHCDAMIA